MASTLANTFEGGTVDVGLTAGSGGNTGGSSGDYFDLITGSGTRTVTFESTPVAHGTRSVQFGVASGATAYAVWNDSWTDGAAAYCRIYFRVSDATPASNTQIIQIRESDGVTVGCDVRLSTTGQIQLRAPSTVRYTSTTVIPVDEWVRLELYVLSSATVGRIQARLYTGANLEGTSPTEEFGSAVTNWDTGNGTIGGMAFGICASAGQALDMYVDDVTFTITGWPGSSTPPAPLEATAPYVGVFAGYGSTAIPVDEVSPLLVPAVGAWFGATTAAQGVQSDSTATGLAEWVSWTGFRPQILSFYKTGTYDGNLSTTYRNMCDPTTGTRAIPFLHMKFNAGGATWAQVAAGAQDSTIDTFFAGVMTYPYRMFLAIHHEPDDDVGASGFSATDYRNMWARVKSRAAAAGVTNVIWVMQYAGYPSNAGSASGSFWESLLPDVDWIGWDPYTWTTTTNTFAKLVNNVSGAPSGYAGFYNWATTNHPGKPLIICETGAGIGTGYLTETQATAYWTEWSTAIPSFPAIKAFMPWNALGIRDYQVQGRTNLAAAVTAMKANGHFANDTALTL